MQPSDKPIVSVENVTFSYEKKPVLWQFTLSLMAGEVAAIVGPSGCGKTTLLQLISGMVEPDAGAVSVNAAPGQIPIAYMFQNYDALPWFTVRQNLAMSGVEDEAGIRAVADSVGIGEMLDRFPRELSGGQQKRVSLARSLLTSPALLIMDEPFGSLDVITKRTIFDLFEREYVSADRSALLVTHSVEEAIMIADRIFVLAGPPLRIIEILKIDAPRPRRTEFLDSEAFKSAELRVMSLMLNGVQS